MGIGRGSRLAVARLGLATVSHPRVLVRVPAPTSDSHLLVKA
jgi:hypothetical protein